MTSAILLLVIVSDQVLKVWVKTHMLLGEHIYITDWFYLLFTENKGMAFGLEFVGTLFLTLFRLIAVVFFVGYAVKMIKLHKPVGYVVCLTLIVAGALGNVIDNCFYGLIFSQSTPFELAQSVPIGQGYGSFLSGHVVDMFYFPIIDTQLPDWLPVGGGSRFVFFSPIFNLADAAISCGAIAILLFYRKMILTEEKKESVS